VAPAVERKFAASTRNQALSALSFFYSKVLNQLFQAPDPKPDAVKSAPDLILISTESRVPILGPPITRKYKERLLEVLVLDEGCKYAGEKFKSLGDTARDNMSIKFRLRPFSSTISASKLVIRL
jgi:hypothetical protein